jgi:hypothetical protein
VHETTEETLTDVILQKLKQYRIPTDNMCGQEYDNHANMKGQHEGAEQKIN